MIVTILARICILVGTAIVAMTIVFLLVHASGDPLDGFLAPGASDEVRQQARARLGLDDPLPLQYLSFVANSLTGNFGTSWRTSQPALDTVLERLPATLRLAGASIAISVSGGLLFGFLSARLNSGLLRFGVRSLALLGQAVPAFWLGSLGILVFAVKLGWLPSSGNEGPSALVLPTITLAAYPGSLIARVTQASLLEVAKRPFVTQAHAKGLSANSVWFRHVAPNALLPALAVVGLQAAFLAGGTIVVESVFAYPGLGRLALQAASDRDLPIVQAFVMVTIVLISIVNVTVDLIAAHIDPAVRRRPGIGSVHG